MTAKIEKMNELSSQMKLDCTKEKNHSRHFYFDFYYYDFLCSSSMTVITTTTKKFDDSSVFGSFFLPDHKKKLY